MTSAFATASDAESVLASQSVQRVAQELARLGASPVHVLRDSARTVAEAALALGVQEGQIAKSVIFRLRDAEAARALLVITAGDRRVCTTKVAALAGAVGRADADFVRATTGFAIGGVSPVAHVQPPVVLVDATLARFDVLWAAAGHPRAVFPCTHAQLSAWWGVGLADVVES